MRVLVACEWSEIVKEQFLVRGHDAHSCDLLAGVRGLSNHHQCDVREIINDGWDLMIAHPPCTFLSASGARWLYDARYPNRRDDQKKAMEFFLELYDAPINKIAIENPVGILSTQFRKPDQIIQPYYFGDEAQKTTCLWLKNLPPLRFGENVQMMFGEDKPPQTKIVDRGKMHITPSGKVIPEWYAKLEVNAETRKLRGVTFNGIAKAMAEQWGKDWNNL